MSETERLIAQVKQKRFLYDLYDPDYKNRQKRQKAWQEIASLMGVGNGNVWSGKWKGLKDNYAKYKKIGDPAFAVAYKKYKNWPWAGYMTFLDEYNNTGVRRVNSHPNRNTSDQGQASQEQINCNVQLFVPDDTLNPTIDELQDPVPEGTENGSCSEFANETRKRKMKNRTESTEEEQERFKIKRNEEKVTMDEVDYFFLSYAQSFKKLPSRMQIMLKLDIATLFSRYELQAEGITNESVDNIPRIVPLPVKIEFDVTNSIED